MVGQRRTAREISLSILFLHEGGDGLTPLETFNLFCLNFRPIEGEDNALSCSPRAFDQALPFVEEIYFGVLNNVKKLDRILETASENWRVERMSRVDRNVMRLALYEMLHRDDIPPKVSINEAIDLGKQFGAEDSGAFINGVLDRIHRQIVEGVLPVKGGKAEDGPK